MEKFAELFKALGDVHRLNILRLLRDQEMCGCEIFNKIELSQPAISHHLKILKQANLVKCIKEGKLVFYRLDESGINIAQQILTDLSFTCKSDNQQFRLSSLRENPNLCEILGMKASVCEEEI
ncbi:MAG: metalloregulator ArsR/SmtB family transcription factor [Desulfosporosinus sp.]|nr:metalloregulator ArsR/SmtB family transcription factor [Desulfosporosinus sp.]